jgi:hypothetical protein
MESKDTLDRIFRAMRTHHWDSPAPTDTELAQAEEQARRYYRSCDFCGQISISRIIKSREPWSSELIEIKQYEDEVWVCEDCLT